VEKLRQLDGSMNGFAVYDGWIYYSTSEEDAWGAYKLRTDGTENLKIADFPIYIPNVVNDKIYYLHGDYAWAMQIYAMNLDGANNERVADDITAMSINVTGDWIYYATDEAVWKIKTDGTNNERIVGGIKTVSINVIGDWIYCATGEEIWKIKTDGTEETKLWDYAGYAIIDAPVQNYIEAPSYNDHSIDTATAFADYFVKMLNMEQDLTGDENAMDSWRDLFDFGDMQIYRSDISEDEYSENMYQFIVSGIKGETVNSATVLISFQRNEPYYICSYTRYYPYASRVATHYVALLAEGDIKQLAKWLSVDGGPDPSSDFIQQAKRGLLTYGSYNLRDAVITDIRFDNDAQRFHCTFKSVDSVSFDVTLIFGDGLIMPE
jgi:hypothetical protein